MHSVKPSLLCSFIWIQLSSGFVLQTAPRPRLLIARPLLGTASPLALQASRSDDDAHVESTRHKSALDSHRDANHTHTVTKYSNMAIKAIGASTTVVVSGVFFVILAWRRDALMVSFFIGSISNGVLSKVLKKVINQTRPPELEHADDIRLKPGDKGMPSSHAMSLGFIATYIACHVAWTQLPLALYVVLSLMYRVQVKLHTWQQVVVGSIVGTLNGWGWFRLCTGDNPWNINVMDALAATILDDTGKLPLPFMIVPLLVGAATIGSFERRIGSWIKQAKSE